MCWIPNNDEKAEWAVERGITQKADFPKCYDKYRIGKKLKPIREVLT